MTIGIAAYGPNAGLAVFRALAAVEKVASGSIGGYAAFAALAPGGRVHRAGTQRGGTSTLFTVGETTGLAPPPEVAGARLAGVMSSGPDRPEPLSQYVPAEAGVGLVTGHRLPNAAGVSGRAVNLEVLARMRRGLSACAAVDEILDDNPGADAGVIAVDLNGGVYGRDSDRVCERPDLGHARQENAASGAVIEVLHNAIQPAGSLAALAADIGLAVMAPDGDSDGEITVKAGVPLAAGTENRVLVDEKDNAISVETTDRVILTGRHNCAAVYLQSKVFRGERVLGYTMFEPNVVVEDGRIAALNGGPEVRIAYRSRGGNDASR